MSEATRVYDPFSYELDEDPYPTYRWMRDEAPLYYNEALDFYALTRFHDNLEAFVDKEAYTSTWSTSLEFMDAPKPGSGLMIWMDPPEHNRFRGLVSRAFTPRRIADLEPQVRSIAAAHLDALVGRERFDAIAEFTARLPMDVISALLGIPEADRRWVQECSNEMMHREPGNPMPLPEAIAAQQRVLAFFDEQIAERRRRPADDMMTVLTQVEWEDEGGGIARLDDEEIRQFLVLLATAGNETVTKLLATLLHELWRNPDERQALIDEPMLIANAAEEILRYDPPSQYQGRVTTRAIELHGQTVPEGSRVLLINGATGRDERVFPDPDRFDVRRAIEIQLGLGYGRHLCLGASLARLETRVASEEWLRRFPHYEIPDDGLERMHSSNVRGLSRLEIEPTPAR